MCKALQKLEEQALQQATHLLLLRLAAIRHQVAAIVVAEALRALERHRVGIEHVGGVVDLGGVVEHVGGCRGRCNGER